MLALVVVYSCRNGLRLHGECEGGKGGGCGWAASGVYGTGKRPQTSFREPVGRRGGVGGVSSPRKRPAEPVGRGVGAPPGSTRKRNKQHHLPCNALEEGSATWTAGLLKGECFSVHCVMFFGQGGLHFMPKKQFLSILRECRGAPGSKKRLSFLHCTGNSAM